MKIILSCVIAVLLQLQVSAQITVWSENFNGLTYGSTYASGASPYWADCPSFGGGCECRQKIKQCIECKAGL